jgi:uncharacterized membrane protein
MKLKLKALFWTLVIGGLVIGFTLFGCLYPHIFISIMAVFTLVCLFIAIYLTLEDQEDRKKYDK